MKTTGIGKGVGIIAAVLPLFSFSTFFYPDINSKFLLLTFAVDALALGIAYHLWKHTSFTTRHSQWTLIALIIVLATQYLATFTGLFPELSLWSDIYWSTGVLFLTHLAIAAVIISRVLTENDWSLMRRSIALGAGVFAALTLIGTNGFGAEGTFLWFRFGESGITLGNETYAGAYLVLAFIFGAIEFLRTDKKSVWRTILGASLIATIISPLLVNIGVLWGETPLVDVVANPALLLGAARASSAALIALLVFATGAFGITKFVKKNRRSALRAWAGLVLAGMVAGTALLFTPGSAVQQAYIQASSAARVIVWGSAWEAITERPLLGYGPETFGSAIQEHADSRLYLPENFGEIWFERAHNVFLDVLTGSGVIGLVAFTLLTIAYLVTLYRARTRELISATEATLLASVVPLHLLQMQTGFDTVPTYFLLALFLAYALSLEYRMGAAGKRLPLQTGKVVAIVLAVLALASVKVIVIDEYTRQAALAETFRLRSAAEQQAAIGTSLSRTSAFESLRLSSSSFIKGALTMLAQQSTPERVQTVLKFTDIYETKYEEYLAVQPDQYRARMNYVYLLLVKTTLGENRLEDAKRILTDSYRLSPENPLTYVLDSVAELYGGNRKEAIRLMDEAVRLAPHTPFTTESKAYLDTQLERFPNLSILRLENL